MPIHHVAAHAVNSIFITLLLFLSPLMPWLVVARTKIQWDLKQDKNLSSFSFYSRLLDYDPKHVTHKHWRHDSNQKGPSDRYTVRWHDYSQQMIIYEIDNKQKALKLKIVMILVGIAMIVMVDNVTLLVSFLLRLIKWKRKEEEVFLSLSLLLLLMSDERLNKLYVETTLVIKKWKEKDRTKTEEADNPYLWFMLLLILTMMLTTISSINVNINNNNSFAVTTTVLFGWLICFWLQILKQRWKNLSTKEDCPKYFNTDLCSL